MTKWEYLRVYVDFWRTQYPLKGGEATVIYSNGVKVYDDKQKPIPIHEFLNGLGKDGWELINGGEGVYYLKRPIE